MNLLNCNTKELAKESGLSYMIINRYINNIRKPKELSEYFDKLVIGLYKITQKNNIKISKKEISEQLTKSLNANTFTIDFDLFIENFNILQKELNLTTMEISKALGYDSSFISRMKNKERKPADFETFIDKLQNYIIIISKNKNMKNALSALFNCTLQDLQDNQRFKDIFETWISAKHIKEKNNQVLNFLSKLDNFNLNDYIGTDFSKVKVPTSPVIIKNSKTYLGSKGRKQAEGDFLKITLLSKSEEPIFFYSDLPLSNIASDKDFKEKWIYVITKLLKKGLHLNIIHNLNRPIDELLLGLENWIPIYMSGSITPYYFKLPPSNFFTCSLCTSGSAALSSTCIKYNENKSMFYLTTKKEEVKFKQEESKYMLSKATPLMEIYKEDNNEDFDKFIQKEKNSKIQKITKDIFKNIDFYINNNKWISINKKTAPEIHFVIHHEKLINAIKTFLIFE